MKAALLVLAAAALYGQGPDYTGSYTVPLIGGAMAYETPPKRNAVERLKARLGRGEVRLEWTPQHGWLRSVLKALDVAESSQCLVYSKTSLQISRISPRTPRAIYFNDDVYVGWVQGGEAIEISVADADRGGVFYTLSQAKSARPEIERGESCLQCHAGPMTVGVPGHLMRSVVADREGYVVMSGGSHLTDHRSRIDERWGGWYVTGLGPGQKHMGRSPAGRVDLRPYVAKTSDAVALMVLAHQVRMHNVMARAGYEARAALELDREMRRAQGGPMTESARRRIENGAEILVGALLFSHEAPVGAVAGGGPFVREFEARGVRETKGRSLREFDLKTRLMKYPCSWLIGSEAFQALPAELRAAVWRRIEDVVAGREQGEGYRRLEAETRRAIGEILAGMGPK